MNVNAEIAQASTGVVSALMEIPLVLILLAIIHRVHDNQMVHYRRQAVDGA